MSIDSIEREKNKNKNKVVAQVPKVGVTTWIPPNPDKNWAAVAKANNMPQGYITATSDPTGSRNKAYLDSFNVDQPAPQVGAVDPFGPGGLEGLISSIRGSGGGSSTAAADGLARDKWNAQQASDAAASAVTLRALQGLQGRLASGGYRGNADTLLGLIDTRNQQGQTAIQGQYDTGTGNINAGYDTGLGMINSGYGDLNKYLNANQIDPYANLQQQVSPVNNAMADYLSAYGVSNDPVTQQVQASSIANQEGANSFNQLQQLQSANQLANNQSNLGVSQAAQNYATTGLGTQRARYLGNAEAARTEALNSFLSSLNDAMYSAGTSRTAGLNTAGSQRTGALNTLADTIAGEQFNVEQGVGNAKTDLENAIIAAGGSTSATAADVNPGTGRVDTGPAAAGPSSTGQPAVAGSATTRAQKVAAAPDIYPNFKAALKAMSPKYKFTTMAAAKKAFKPLAAAFKK